MSLIVISFVPTECALVASVARGGIGTHAAAIDEERALIAADQIAALDKSAGLDFRDPLRRPRVRSANRADRRLRVNRLARFHRPRHLDTSPAKIGDNAPERPRRQGGHEPDDERLEHCWRDCLMLLQVSGVMPAWIDFEGTQRVQTALLERNGSAWPMSECLAF